MDKIKYKIMFDYGSYEGYKLQDGEFETIDEAVKHAVSLSYSSPFIIVDIVWKPEYKNLLSKENKNNG